MKRYGKAEEEIEGLEIKTLEMTKRLRNRKRIKKAQVKTRRIRKRRRSRH